MTTTVRIVIEESVQLGGIREEYIIREEVEKYIRFKIRRPG